jgi:sugar lactone lactonase YvrE
MEGLAVGPSPEVYFSDLNGQSIHRYDTKSSASELVAGTGIAGRAASGTAALRASLNGPAALAVGPDGELYFSEIMNGTVRMLHRGVVTTLIGPPESVLAPIAVGPDGAVYLGDQLHTVRRILPSSGRIDTFLGSGQPGAEVVGKSPLQAEFTEPHVAFLGDQIYVVDPHTGYVRRLEGRGKQARIIPFAGNGLAGPAQAKNFASATPLMLPFAIAKHPTREEVYLATVWLPKILRIDTNGLATLFAGTGMDGFGGDNGKSTNAKFNYPTSLAFDKNGNLYVADFFNHRIRVISPGGIITTFAGTGNKGYKGDGGPANQAELYHPNDVTFGPDGYIYCTDMNNHCIRKISVDPPHIISTVAGTGKRGFSGDGGRANQAQLNLPRGLAFGPDGNLYVTDSFNNRVRAIRLR